MDKRVAWRLAQASHLAPTLAVTLFSTVLAARLGSRADGRSLLAGAAVFAGQLSVGWSNDYVDRGRDRAAGRAGKPLVGGGLDERVLGASAAIAVVVCAVLSLAVGWLAGVVHLTAVASAWTYNLALKATAASVVPYLVSFGLLPVFLALAVRGAAPPWWLVVAGALLGAGAHFTNTIGDLAVDAATGVRGLPHRLGARRSVYVAAGALTLACVCVAAGSWPLGAWTAVAVAACLGCVAGVAVAGFAGLGRWSFRLTIAAAAAAVGAVLASAGRGGA